MNPEEPKSVAELLQNRLTAWLDGLQLGESEKCQIHVNIPPQRIDPEKGLLQQAFVIQVTRQMEKVESEPAPKLEPLPPIPDFQKSGLTTAPPPRTD